MLLSLVFCFCHPYRLSFLGVLRLRQLQLSYTSFPHLSSPQTSFPHLTRLNRYGWMALLDLTWLDPFTEHRTFVSRGSHQCGWPAGRQAHQSNKIAKGCEFWKDSMDDPLRFFSSLFHCVFCAGGPSPGFSWANSILVPNDSMVLCSSCPWPCKSLICFFYLLLYVFFSNYHLHSSHLISQAHCLRCFPVLHSWFAVHSCICHSCPKRLGLGWHISSTLRQVS